MGTSTPTSPPDKPVTVDVPAHRVPEFYAFFARFLAAGEGGERRRGGRRGGRGPGHGPGARHRHCHHRDDVHASHEAVHAHEARGDAPASSPGPAGPGDDAPATA